MKLLAICVIFIAAILMISAENSEGSNAAREENDNNSLANLLEKRYRLQGKRYRLYGPRETRMNDMNENLSLDDDDDDQEDGGEQEEGLDKRYRIHGKRYRIQGKRYRIQGGKRYRLYGH